MCLIDNDGVATVLVVRSLDTRSFIAIVLPVVVIIVVVISASLPVWSVFAPNRTKPWSVFEFAPL